ncbi:MAG TPA: DUF2911 domain-containing protein [Bryobacteraceae bacterium]|nr:DUF2911 domain-containing protein [Bryobacteraceae bacterium]
MKPLLALAAALILAPGPAAAQAPRQLAKATLGGKAVSISYTGPSVRGRKVFSPEGPIAKDGTYPVWRAGADSATSLHTETDLDIGGLKVPKGDYTLFVNLKDVNNWELIVNKQTGQWGLTYNAAQDLGRVKMTMAKPAAPVETLKYTITASGGTGKLTLEWENYSASVNIAAK